MFSLLKAIISLKVCFPVNSHILAMTTTIQCKVIVVSRKADQIERQCFLFSVAIVAIEGDLETIALASNKGLIILTIHEGNSNSLLLQ